MSALISFGITLASAGEIVLPIAGTVSNVVIDWGDSSTNDTVNSPNPSHTYSSAGSYTINITSGSFTALKLYGGYLPPDPPFLFNSSLTSFSYNTQIAALTDFQNAFGYAPGSAITTNFTLYFAQNVTNNVTNMREMFASTSAFNNSCSVFTFSLSVTTPCGTPFACVPQYSYPSFCFLVHCSPLALLAIHRLHPGIQFLILFLLDTSSLVRTKHS